MAKKSWRAPAPSGSTKIRPICSSISTKSPPAAKSRNLTVILKKIHRGGDANKSRTALRERLAGRRGARSLLESRRGRQSRPRRRGAGRGAFPGPGDLCAYQRHRELDRRG